MVQIGYNSMKVQLRVTHSTFITDEKIHSVININGYALIVFARSYLGIKVFIGTDESRALH
jgi:hypothetical protein